MPCLCCGNNYCSDAEDEDQVSSRLQSFLAALRYHNPTTTASGGLRSAIVVSHSLFIKEFCSVYAGTAERASSRYSG
eukprot:COSAG06_NODE_49351_length_326_cov_0.665198_1_plen_76_part_01